MSAPPTTLSAPPSTRGDDTLSPYEVASDKLSLDMGLMPLFSTIGIAMLAGGSGMWGLHLTTLDRLSWPEFLLLHLINTALVGIWAYIMTRANTNKRDSVAMVLAQITLGPLGCGGMILMQVMLFILRRRAKGFMEWYMSLFPDEHKGMGRALYDSLTTGRERDDNDESITSFSDVLEVGTPQQKQTILALLARNFRPEFAPALKRAMNDPDTTVRVMAATAAARIENAFLDKALTQRRLTEENPEHFPTWLNMARLYDDYAFTGILDGDREKENRVLAHDAYGRCRELEPDNATPVIALGRLALRSGQHDMAVSWFQTAHALDKDRTDITIWLIEALYMTQNYDDVRALSLELGLDLDAVKGLPEDVKRSVRLWRGEDT